MYGDNNSDVIEWWYKSDIQYWWIFGLIYEGEYWFSFSKS